MTTVADAKRVQRGTRQWAAVSAMLDRLDDFRAAQEIHAELRPAGEGIGLAIVYRSLKALPTAARWTCYAPALAKDKVIG